MQKWDVLVKINKHRRFRKRLKGLPVRLKTETEEPQELNEE